MASQPINFPPQLHLDVRKNDGNVEVFCRGRLTAETANGFKQQIRDIISNEKTVVLDLSDLNHVDSTGLGTLVSLWVSAKKQGCDLKLISLSERVKELLHLTKLDQLFATSRFPDKPSF
jgi:anti-anti-sigma factor